MVLKISEETEDLPVAISSSILAFFPNCPSSIRFKSIRSFCDILYEPKFESVHFNAVGRNKDDCHGRGGPAVPTQGSAVSTVYHPPIPCPHSYLSSPPPPTLRILYIHISATHLLVHHQLHSSSFHPFLVTNTSDLFSKPAFRAFSFCYFSSTLPFPLLSRCNSFSYLPPLNFSFLLFSSGKLSPFRKAP